MSRPQSLLLVLVLLAVTVPAAAQEKQYELSNFDVTIALHPDGTYEVDETITYDFQQGTFTYAYRSISTDDVGAVWDVRVTSPNATLDSLQTTEEDDVLRVRWTFSERTEPIRVQIHYVLDDAIYEQGDRNVVDRDVMAPEAIVPTHDVDVRVVLPAAFTLTRDQVTLEPETSGQITREAGQIVAHFHQDRVEEGDDFPIAVSFPKQVAGEFLPTGWHIMAALVLLLFGIGGGVVVNRSWRGPRPDVSARRPPRDVDLPTAAVLLKNRSQQAFPAVLFDLVQRGHLTLTHDREEGLFGSSDVVQLDVHPDRFDLSDFETAFVDTIATYDTLDDFWSDTRSFRKEQIRSVRDRIVERGWLERHTARSNALIVSSVLVLSAGLATTFIADAAWALFAFFGGTGGSAGGFIASARRHTWTDAGARRAMALRSFLDHEKSEIDRLREADPVRAAERLVDSLSWLMLHDDVSSSWIEDVTEALDGADAAPKVPDGFVSLVSDRETESAAMAAFLPVVSVIAATESSGGGAAGAGAAGAGGAAGGGAAGAG